MVLGLVACQRDEPLFIAKIYPAESTPMGLGSEAITRAVGQALSQSGFVVREGTRRNYVAKVTLAREADMNAQAAIDKWHLRVVLSPVDGEAMPLSGAGDVFADEAVPHESELADAAALAAGELAEERKLLLRPSAEVQKALSADSREVRDFAVRLAGQRKLKGLVPVLCERLASEPEPDLVLRIVGALVQIGDQRAVGPLVDLTKRRHPVFINQIVFAVAQIGGAEAEAYLDTLAQGHPSDQVREAAKEALRELIARKTAGHAAKGLDLCSFRARRRTLPAFFAQVTSLRSSFVYPSPALESPLPLAVRWLIRLQTPPPTRRSRWYPRPGHRL